MDLLLILTYTGLCIVIFKVFKIPLNKWTVPTAVLGGIFIIGTLIMLMNYNHPFTANARQVYTSVPIMPLVSGRVEEVAVKANQRVHKGDLLFRIDDTAYRAAVKQAEADLSAAIQQVPQLQARWESAKANSEAALAERDRSYKVYKRYADGRKKGGKNSPFTESEVDNRRQAFLANEAKLHAAKAVELEAELAYNSDIGGVNTQVAKLRAALEQAQFNFDQTTIEAPSDGYATQVGLRPGMVAVPMPLRPVMTFIPIEEDMIIGAFWENSLKRLKAGDEAEFIVTAMPGKVFKGTVKHVIPVMAEGEFQANGSLRDASTFFTHSRSLVVVTPDAEFSEQNLPLGIGGQMAIYTEHFHHVSVIRKVLLRMTSWMNYLFPFH